MASVVGKTIFSDGKGKLFFGYYKDNDAIEFVDYKTWKKLSFKDVSKGDTNKQRVIKSIVKNQKQFNKKVDFNMWAKKQKRSFEDTMEWFIKNGWISNITKRGIKESVDVLSVNEDRNSNMFYVLYQKKGVLGKPAAAGYKDRKDAEKFAKSLGSNHNTMILDKQSMKNVKGVDVKESVNEAASKEAMGIAALTGTRGSAVQDFIDKNRINSRKLFNALKKANLQGRINFASALAGKPGNPNAKLTIKLFGESVNEAKLKPKKLNQLKKGEKFVFNNKPFEFISLYTSIPNAAKVKTQDGKTSVVSFGGMVNKNTKGGFSDYLKQGGRVWDNVNPTNSPSVNESKFGYKTSTASYINKHKDEYKKAEKMNKGNEMKFYDMLQQMEDKVGHPKTMLFISNALRGYDVDMYKDPKIKNPADAQEALFLLSK